MRSLLGCFTLLVGLALAAVVGAMLLGAAGAVLAIGLALTWLGHRRR